MAHDKLDWYDTPRFYDIVFDTDSAREFAFLREAWKKHVRSRGERVLEPACGTARLLARFARAGCAGAGFDANSAMIDYARRRMARGRLRADLRVGRMESLRYASRFDFAFNLVSTFKYLLTEEQAKAHLACVAASLRPGGVYALGFHLTDYANTRLQRERWVGTRGRTTVVCNIQGWPADARNRTEKVRSRLAVEENGQEKRYETSWTFRTYSAEQFRSLLASVPQLELIATYDFHYEIDAPKTFGEEGDDQIIILRRR